MFAPLLVWQRTQYRSAEPVCVTALSANRQSLIHGQKKALAQPCAAGHLRVHLTLPLLPAGTLAIVALLLGGVVQKRSNPVPVNFRQPKPILISLTFAAECTVIPVFWSGVFTHFGSFHAPWFWYSFASKSQANRPKMNLVPVRAQHIVSANFVLTQSAKCTQSLITVPELVGFGLTDRV